MSAVSFPKALTSSAELTNQERPNLVNHKDRIDWADFAKGIGILLVVLGHVLGGLIQSGVLPSHGAFSFAVDYIYSFHMPFFFFLSGLFVRSSARRPFRSYLANKISVIVYPYFLWSLATGLLQHFVSRSNNVVSWLDLAKIPYIPIDQYWFLYVIFCMYVLFWLLYRLSVPTPIIFLVTVALYVCEVSGIDLAEWDVLHSLCALLIYFCLGALIAETSILDRLFGFAWFYLLIIVVANYGLIGTITAAGGLGQPILHLLAAIAGIFATVSLAMLLSRSNRFFFIRTWGVLSLEIFVAHTIFASGFRIVAQKALGIESPFLHIAVGTAIGIYAPILLSAVCSKTGFPYLFKATRTPPRIRPALIPDLTTR